MDDDVALTIQIPPEYLEQLETIARLTKQSISEVAVQAFTEFFTELDESDREEVQQALAEADAGAHWVDHEEVRAWAESLGTEHELPRPR